jgi:hypothetical protein
MVVTIPCSGALTLDPTPRSRRRWLVAGRSRAAARRSGGAIPGLDDFWGRGFSRVVGSTARAIWSERMSTQAEQAQNVPALCRPACIFPVRDLDFSLAFYERLGFRTDAYDEGYGFARRERLRLHLRAVPGLDPLANNSGVYVDAPAVDALHSEWLGCGLRVVPADI